MTRRPPRWIVLLAIAMAIAEYAWPRQVFLEVHHHHHYHIVK